MSPIKPENRARYPRDWKAISKRIRFERAGNRCEWCTAENHQPHPVTGSKVVLTVAHLDHALVDHSDENLAALCQRCHLTYDRTGVRLGPPDPAQLAIPMEA